MGSLAALTSGGRQAGTLPSPQGCASPGGGDRAGDGLGGSRCSSKRRTSQPPAGSPAKFRVLPSDLIMILQVEKLRSTQANLQIPAVPTWLPCQTLCSNPLPHPCSPSFVSAVGRLLGWLFFQPVTQNRSPCSREALTHRSSAGSPGRFCTHRLVWVRRFPDS